MCQKCVCVVVAEEWYSETAERREELNKDVGFQKKILDIINVQQLEGNGKNSPHAIELFTSA